MAGSVNKVILIGNLGKDPEIRRLENGAVVANFSLATSETYTEKNTGERRETTDWHNIVVWRGLAEVVEKYIHKGTKVYVEGKLKTRNWQDKEGNTRYTTEVLAEEITILSRPNNDSNNTSNLENKSVYPSANAAPIPPISSTDFQAKSMDDEADDLPF